MGWTAIDINTSWQDLAIAQEIAAAYNLRADACGADHIEATGAVTVYDFVRAAQLGIGSMLALQGGGTFWADPSGRYTGSTSGSVWDNVWDFSAFMTYVGLYGNGVFPGWRRVTEYSGGVVPANWESYHAWADTVTGGDFGVIEDKDLAGPWLFIDLQTALSGLTRLCVLTAMYTSKYSVGSGIPMSPSTPQNTEQTGYNYAQATVSKAKISGSQYSQSAEYRSSSFSLESTSASKTVRAVALAWTDGHTFYDFGTGYVQGEYNVLVNSTWTDSTATSFTSLVFGQTLANWAALLDELPWAGIGADETQTIELLITGSCWVVDYLFDP